MGKRWAIQVPTSCRLSSLTMKEVASGASCLGLAVHLEIDILGDRGFAGQWALLSEPNRLLRFRPRRLVQFEELFLRQQSLLHEPTFPLTDWVVLLLVAFDLLFCPVNLV